MADLPDAALPVCPFRVNWRDGVTERLEWKTDTQADFLGNEQRRALRLTPRREWEVTLSLWDGERAFWDLWLHRLGGTEFLFPLWHDSVRAAQEAAQGDSEVRVDTRALEFTAGSYALLRGPTALSCQRVLVQEVHDDRIVLSEPLAVAWPKGTRVEPLVRGRLSEQNDVKAITSRVSETTVVFEGTRAQPYALGVDSWDQFLGVPVLPTGPNRSEEVSAQFAWAFSESDSETGRRYRKSDSGRAFVQQKHSWLLRGRTAKSEFRSLLYRLSGAAGALWLPTFNDDLQMTRDTPDGVMSLYVRNIGWSYTGGATSGREYVVIELVGGTRIFRRITGTAASGNPAEERLLVNAAFPGGLLRSAVRRISFMDTARLQNDRVEFKHVNAADGASTVSSIFQTFRNERQAPAILSLPIPAAEMLEGPCGPGWDDAIGDPCGPPRACGWETALAIQTPITRPCPGSVGHPSFMYIGFPHPNLPDITLYEFGQPKQQSVVAKANDPLGIPEGTPLVDVNGLNVYIHVPLYIGPRDGSSRRKFYVYGEWPNRPDNTNMCIFDFTTNTFIPEIAYVSGGVADPQQNCEIVLTPFYEMRYISYASHAFQFEFNQTVYDGDRWEDY